MEIQIVVASMTQTEEGGYAGTVQFRVEGHKQPYEMTLNSKRGRDWDYSLSFLQESGPEEEIMAVDAALEQDDELFNRFLEAAENALESAAK